MRASWAKWSQVSEDSSETSTAVGVGVLGSPEETGTEDADSVNAHALV